MGVLKAKKFLTGVTNMKLENDHSGLWGMHKANGI